MANVSYIKETQTHSHPHIHTLSLSGRDIEMSPVGTEASGIRFDNWDLDRLRMEALQRINQLITEKKE